jgi:hypothetical protein
MYLGDADALFEVRVMRGHQRWSLEEISVLRTLFPIRRTAEVASLLGRSTATVAATASSLGLHKGKAFLASAASGRFQKGPVRPKRKPDYSRFSGPPKKWSSEEIDRLRQVYGTKPVEDVASLLGRTKKSVASKAKTLRLGKRKFWTPEELDRVRELYPHLATSEVAKALGRSELSVYQAADKLGLRKTPERLKQVGIQPGSNLGAAYRFQKGLVPANKGVKRPGWAPGRMSETQFKPGARSGKAAENYRLVGTVLAADPEGFLRVKVRDHGPGCRGWHPEVWPLVHHKVWEENKGPIPEGHHVAFKDGNRQNCAIENLELVSQAEMMARNTIWNVYPRELAELIQLNGQLKRRIRSSQNGKEQNVGSEGPSVRDAGSAA